MTTATAAVAAGSGIWGDVDSDTCAWMRRAVCLFAYARSDTGVI